MTLIAFNSLSNLKLNLTESINKIKLNALILHTETAHIVASLRFPAPMPKK